MHSQHWAMIDTELNAALTGTAKLAQPALKKPKRALWMVTLLSLIDPLLHVKPSDMSYKVDDDGRSVTSVHLSVTKPAPQDEEVAWGPNQQPDIDPDMLLVEHMRVNKSTCNGPLFVWHHKNRV